jgi:hypothetical protein
MTENIAITPSASKRKQRRSAQARGGLQGLINLALMVWMIWDLRHRSDEELNGKRKWWMLAAFAPPIGPIVYSIYLRRRRTQASEIPLDITDQSDISQPEI